MAHIGHQETNYHELAASKGLEFVSAFSPTTIREKVLWRCKHCGTVTEKTYRAVQVAKYGCKCQNGKKLPVDYYALAEQLGITWLGEVFYNREPDNPNVRLPLNTKDKTYWSGDGYGSVIVASYYQLAYNPSKQLRKLLGIKNEPG